jgi:hypothetical protein
MFLVNNNLADIEIVASPESHTLILRKKSPFPEIRDVNDCTDLAWPKLGQEQKGALCIVRRQITELALLKPGIPLVFSFPFQGSLLIFIVSSLCQFAHSQRSRESA